MNKILQSSSNAKEVSLTVKGVLASLAPLAIAVLANAGVEMAESDYAQLVELTTAIISSTMILIGLLRKGYNEFKSLYKQLKK